MLRFFLTFQFFWGAPIRFLRFIRFTTSVQHLFGFLIIHLWRLLRGVTVKIWKIHWKLMTFESQYRFANISATKAQIFIKFETYIYKIVKIYQKIFCKDSCTYTNTRGLNVRARFFAMKRACAYFCLMCGHMHTDLFEKLVDNSLLQGVSEWLQKSLN